MLAGQQSHPVRPTTRAPPPVTPTQAPHFRQQHRRRLRCQNPSAARTDPTPHSSSIAAPAPAVAAEALRQWVVQHSPPLPADLAPAPVAGSGFGMVTRQHVQQGQALVRVPQQLMLTQDSARRSRACGSVCSRPEVTEWQVSHVCGVAEPFSWAGVIYCEGPLHSSIVRRQCIAAVCRVEPGDADESLPMHVCFDT